VAQEEDPLPFVRGAHVGRSDTEPLDIEPAFGQEPENFSKLPPSISCPKSPDIFEKDPSGSNLANDAHDGGENPALVLRASAFPSNGHGRAGEASHDAIHGSGPLGPVDILQVAAPNRSWLQGRVFHPGQENGRSIGFPLSVSHHPGVGDCEAESLVEHPNA